MLNVSLNSIRCCCCCRAVCTLPLVGFTGQAFDFVHIESDDIHRYIFVFYRIAILRMGWEFPIDFPCPCPSGTDDCVPPFYIGTVVVVVVVHPTISAGWIMYRVLRMQ